MSLPPFRAEHIGSLLRPATLLEARRRFARGEIDQQTLTAAEDRAIEDAIRLQERVGLRLATDGEFRRASYHSYFYGQLGDISFEAPAEDAAGGRAAQPVASIRSRIAWKGPIHAADFSFLRARTKTLPKITIPGPCALHFRGGDAAVTKHAYREVDEFWDDIVAAFRSELRSLASAGCSYVQIDETAFAKFGDRGRSGEPACARRRSGRADRQIHRRHQPRARRAARSSASACISAAAIAPGNGMRKEATRQSPRSCSTGSRFTFFFLEYDSPRAGDFAPLRLVPQDKTIVLGLVSTKMNFLEDKSALKRRLDEASRHVPLEHLAVSPQCGFASTEVGNPISPEMQEAKLRLVVELAQETWGTA